MTIQGRDDETSSAAARWSARVAERQQDHPAFAYVEDDRSLPRVLLIGDSISMSYTVPVRSRLRGFANVHRAPDNCRSTRQTREHLDEYLDEGPWDVVHFNFGIHDITRIGPDGKASADRSGEPQVSISEYEANLEHIIDRLEQTGAILVWASTTAVQPRTPARAPEDVVRYNRAAETVARAHDIVIDDLYTLCAHRLSELQPPRNVHFTESGAELLAGQVANSIRSVLGVDKTLR